MKAIIDFKQRENVLCKSNTKKRESNIEILRIISIILITMHHYALYSGVKDVSEITFIFAVWGGKIGVELFVMISGYFLVSSKFETRKIIKLWLQVFTYSIIPPIIYNIAKGQVSTFDNLYKYFFPASNRVFWFFSDYIQLYLLSPFIIKILNNTKKETLKKLIIMITMIFIALRIELYRLGIGVFNGIFSFICFFSIGAYIKLYEIKFLENKKKRNVILILIILLIYFSIKIIIFKIPKLGQLEEFKIILNSITDYSEGGLFTITMSLLLFYIIKETKIRFNKIINILGSTSFAVYLITEHPILRFLIWRNLFNISYINLSLDGVWKSKSNIFNKIMITPTVFLKEVTRNI